MSSDLIPRKLKIDFSGVPLHWTRIPEYSSMQNAGSPVATLSEYFVNWVMGQLRDELTSRGLDELSEQERNVLTDINLFVKQETNHAHLHASFNREMYARGYGAVKPYEGKLKDYYQKLREEKSLAFNLAYCAGFENIALFSAKFVFIAAPDLFEGGDPRMTDLFKWHLAEEFEHRTVAHAAFMMYSGNYWLRLKGAWEAFKSLNKFQDEILQIILAVDRETMTAEEIKASKRRVSKLKRRMGFFILPRLFQILLPNYDPSKHEMPANIRSSLLKYEQMASAAA